MDYEDVAQISNISTTPITPSKSYDNITHEVIFALFAIAAIIANFLIVYTIFRYKRMRTAPYMYLASWAIADLFSLFLLPSGLRLISIIEHVPLPYKVFCIMYQSGLVFHCGTIIFVTLVALDWAIAAYFPRASERFRKWYQLTLSILWGIVLTLVFVAVYGCWAKWLHFILPLIMLIITLSLAFLVVTVIHAIRLVQKLRRRSSEYSGLAINLATVFLGCWVLNILNVMFMFRFYFYEVVVVLSFCIIYSSSTINFCLLWRFNNDFNACVRQVLSCKSIKYKEDLSDRVSVQNNVHSDSVCIDFSNTTNIRDTRRM